MGDFLPLQLKTVLVDFFEVFQEYFSETVHNYLIMFYFGLQAQFDLKNQFPSPSEVVLNIPVKRNQIGPCNQTFGNLGNQGIMLKIMLDWRYYASIRPV